MNMRDTLVGAGHHSDVVGKAADRPIDSQPYNTKDRSLLVVS